jgi:phospholipid/cholesterol/gamma-HCH transport system ATP-binding protein
MPAPAPQLPLEVVGLRASYGDAVVLDDISFRVRPAEVRVILGVSGCGKSTLLKHLVGLLRPDAGTVALLGCDVHQAAEPVRARTLHRVGMLFQGGALVHSLSVRDNVALPLTACVGLSARDAADIAQLKLEMVGLGAAAQRMPSQLSGGMKKRAALARAMALDPEVLFCDEPGAGLDPVRAHELDALILGLRDQLGTTVVLVTHELHSIRQVADEALMLHEGRVLADGPLAQVMAHGHPAAQNFFAPQARGPGTRAPTLWDALSQKDDR